MSKREKYFTLSGETPADARLRTITASDCETLRVWKNANREAFFHKEIITPKEQKAWFSGYLIRPDDLMFIVDTGVDVGCMGIRLDSGAVDVYNVIRGDKSGRRGLMREAMLLMCAFARSHYEGRIGCRVLSQNPAVAWYEQCGFAMLRERETHVEMELSTVQVVDFEVTPFHSEGRGAI